MAVYLLMDPASFGIKNVPHVKAAYESLEHARIQGDYNAQHKSHEPIAIVDEQGIVLYDYRTKAQ